jgi:hypothetical protein
MRDNDTSTLEICNEILSLEDQGYIMKAAQLAHYGQERRAELYRKAADYAGLSEAASS